jgi:hypothetical protein
MLARPPRTTPDALLLSEGLGDLTLGPLVTDPHAPEPSTKSSVEVHFQPVPL